MFVGCGSDGCFVDFAGHGDGIRLADGNEDARDQEGRCRFGNEP